MSMDKINDYTYSGLKARITNLENMERLGFPESSELELLKNRLVSWDKSIADEAAAAEEASN